MLRGEKDVTDCYVFKEFRGYINTLRFYMFVVVGKRRGKIKMNGD
jgi:hypothetical protein